MYRIEGKVALVTGSTAGLGKELALQLCMRGARVVLNGRDQEKLDRTASEFKTKGFEVASVRGDVTSPEDCRNMVDHCTGSFGRLDILVSNAGLSSGGRFIDTTPEAFRRIYEVNTLGTIYITRFALPQILETEGSIVFISSLAALVGLPFSSLYSSSKMALTATAQALQAELAESRVHVGVVYIGFLKNPPEKRILGPDGTLQHPGKRDVRLVHSMDKASKEIIGLIQKRKRQKVLTFMGNLLYIAQRFTPWLVSWFMKRSTGKAKEIYEPLSS